MFGSFLRVLAVVALVVLVAGIGVSIYNAGVSQGAAEAARAVQVAGDEAAVIVPPYAGPYGYGYGWGHWGPGFGFFGILFGIFFLFLIFGLIRAAFGWGRWGGRGRGPGGHWGGREERIAEYHRELHKRDIEPTTG